MAKSMVTWSSNSSKSLINSPHLGHRSMHGLYSSWKDSFFSPNFRNAPISSISFCSIHLPRWHPEIGTTGDTAFINMRLAHIESVLVYLCIRAKSLHSCPALCDPVHCSSPGSSVHGILQARILNWVAMPCSRASSHPKDWTHISYISCIGRKVLYH